MESENGSENEGNIPSGKRLHNYWKSAFWMGKSTISTGPWLQVRKLSQSLPGQVMFLNLVHHFPNIQVPFRVVQICQDSTVFWPPAEEGVCGGVQPVGRAAVQLQTHLPPHLVHLGADPPGPIFLWFKKRDLHRSGAESFFHRTRRSW